jgi:alpha-tubulin suppressor-like RCC1 family protein/uncharacterized protein YjdB
MLVALLVQCGGESTGPGSRVVRVAIAPANPVVTFPATVTLTATARDAADSVISGKTITWLTDDSSVASISPSGILQGRARGSTAVRARVDGVEGATTATVVMPVVLVKIAPTVDTVFAYDTAVFTAVAIDKNGDTVPNPIIRWTSSNDSLASIDSAGIAITLEAGTDSIRATVGNTTQSAVLDIKPPRVASVTVGSSTTQIPLRATEQFYVSTYDAKGRSLQGRDVTLRSSDPSVISISYVGVATALSGGTVTITATSEGVTSPGDDVTVLILPTLNFLAVGDFRSCAIGADSAAYCWGANNYGELGDGTTSNRRGPALVTGGLHWASLSSGDFHTCGLIGSGAAYCWGRNDQGQLGTGTTSDSHVPVPVSGSLTFQSIAAGSAYTCGVTDSHEAYCWGANGQGQLGTGNTSPSLTPVLVQGVSTFESISASRIEFGGAIVTCGVTTSGDGYCWGTNKDGQLGTGDSVGSATPRLVGGSHQWTAISASTFHACGRDTVGAAFCWGANPYGGFGDGTLTSTALPTAVDSGPYLNISAGYLFGCAVESSGTLLCFGDNTSYQLGIDGPSQLESPTAPAPAIQFTTARAGRTHACALNSSGEVYCWGSSISGESGADALSSVHTPFKVVGQPQ